MLAELCSNRFIKRSLTFLCNVLAQWWSKHCLILKKLIQALPWSRRCPNITSDQFHVSHTPPGSTAVRPQGRASSELSDGNVVLYATGFSSVFFLCCSWMMFFYIEQKTPHISDSTHLALMLSSEWLSLCSWCRAGRHGEGRQVEEQHCGWSAQVYFLTELIH